jgi:hypothetical protein
LAATPNPVGNQVHRPRGGFGGEEGVLFVGKTQEKTTTFRTEKRRNAETGASYPVDRADDRDGQPVLHLLR